MTDLAASWPKSLLGIPLAAVAFGIQMVPVVRLFVEWLQYVPGGLLYATAVGIGYETLSGRAALVWLIVPIGVTMLSPLPHWQERRQVGLERTRVAQVDQAGFGPGASRIAITVEGVDTARALVRRYITTTVYAERDGTSVGFLRVTPSARISEPVVSPVPDEPEGTIKVSNSSYAFRHGSLEGYEPKLEATWPDGRKRARVGAVLYRVTIPPYLIAGCPSGPWLSDAPWPGAVGSPHRTAHRLQGKRRPRSSGG